MNSTDSTFLAAVLGAVVILGFIAYQIYSLVGYLINHL
jgi:hypothetical protein